MSSLAFLHAPSREIPTEFDQHWFHTVQSWLSIANRTWTNLREELPEEERKLVPRMLPGLGLSSNMASASLRKDPQLIDSAKPWVERAWKEWNDSGRKDPLPVLDSATAHEALGLDSRITLSLLTGYSGGFKEIPAAKLKRGGKHSFLKSEGDMNAFAFGEADSYPRELFLEVARGHGGDHIAVWTFGHALHALVARSPKPGARVTVYGPFSLRARVPEGSKRPGGFVDGLKTAVSGSAFHPHFDALERELAKPELSVARCFEAFGIPGARDFSSPDVTARWQDVDSVGHALLTAQPVDKTQLKNVNELLEPLGDTKLPVKGQLGKGETARLMANAMLELRDSLGVPESGTWAERFKAAGWYWDICDGDALDRLTAGIDRAGVGAGAAVTRLLAHFPEPLLRDPLFLALLALECEAANGHAYVEGLCKLAENTAAAGLVLVVAPAAQRAAMREVFGIDLVAGATGNSSTSFCGEALISGTTVAKGDMAQVAHAWMGKAKVTGAVAGLSPDGNAKLSYYKDGVPAKDAKDAGLGVVNKAALKDAAEKFLPRKAFIALGASDLLEPGAWREGSYAGESVPGVEDHRTAKRRHANALLDTAPAPQPIKHAGELRAVLGPRLRYGGPLKETEGGIVSLGIVSPSLDAIWLRDLRNDLKGQNFIDRYGEAWLQGSEVRGYSCSSLDVPLLVQLLGDAPSGTAITAASGTELLGSWRIS
ncbi:MAG TPA: hypothetical protein VEI73_11920 [Candidatus Acidoferrum sp.]|nr:hypothetical protein [Candidatus Acidoferrum sp.]